MRTYKLGLIYKIVNKINGKIYIGQTTDYKRRKWSHNRAAFNKRQSSYWCLIYRAFRKYGTDNFEYHIVEDNIPINSLNERETYWVSYYDSYLNGYNMTEGGDAFGRGIKNGAYNHTIYTFYSDSEEFTGTCYEFYTKYNLGRGVMSIVSGRIKNWRGWRMTKEKIKIKNQKRNDICDFYHIDGKVHEKISIIDFCKLYKFSKGNILEVINGNSSHHKGWFVNLELYEKYKSSLIFNINKNKYDFYHMYTGEVEKSITVTKMINKHSLRRSDVYAVIRGEHKSTLGWVLSLDKPVEKYNFIHDDYIIESNVTLYYMYKKYPNLNRELLKKVVNGKRKSTSGWKLHL